MYADIPAIARLRTLTGIVTIPHVGVITTADKIVDLSKLRGPRRKQVWAFIQRCIDLKLIEEYQNVPGIEEAGILVADAVEDTASPVGVIETPIATIEVPLAPEPVTEPVAQTVKPSRKKSSLF